MKFLLVRALRLYQKNLSPILVLLFGHACRYHPTCSEYTLQAVSKYGVLRGLKLGVGRIASCHPYSSRSSFDPLS